MPARKDVGAPSTAADSVLPGFRFDMAGIIRLYGKHSSGR
jgi:hypothetical protein